MRQYVITTPPGYFNATDMIPEDPEGKRRLKPSQFLDNEKIQRLFLILNKYPKIFRGRGACTFIPLEIKYIFRAWLILNNVDEYQIKEDLLKENWVDYSN